jgi:hypothetical protein
MVAIWMMVAVTVVILVGLNIRHEDLATDVTPGQAAALAEGATTGEPPEIPPQGSPAAEPSATSPASDTPEGRRVT